MANDARDTKLPWYRSGMVWFGILLTLLLLAGYSLLIYVSHQQANHDHPVASIKQSDELNQLFGIPFSRDQLKQNNNNNDKTAPADSTTAATP